MKQKNVSLLPTNEEVSAEFRTHNGLFYLYNLQLDENPFIYMPDSKHGDLEYKPMSTRRTCHFKTPSFTTYVGGNWVLPKCPIKHTNDMEMEHCDFRKGVETNLAHTASSSLTESAAVIHDNSKQLTVVANSDQRFSKVVLSKDENTMSITLCTWSPRSDEEKCIFPTTINTPTMGNEVNLKCDNKEDIATTFGVDQLRYLRNDRVQVSENSKNFTLLDPTIIKEDTPISSSISITNTKEEIQIPRVENNNLKHLSSNFGGNRTSDYANPLNTKRYGGIKSCSCTDIPTKLTSCNGNVTKPLEYRPEAVVEAWSQRPLVGVGAAGTNRPSSKSFGTQMYQCSSSIEDVSTFNFPSSDQPIHGQNDSCSLTVEQKPESLSSSSKTQKGSLRKKLARVFSRKKRKDI